MARERGTPRRPMSSTEREQRQGDMARMQAETIDAMRVTLAGLQDRVRELEQENRGLRVKVVAAAGVVARARVAAGEVLEELLKVE